MLSSQTKYPLANPLNKVSKNLTDDARLALGQLFVRVKKELKPTRDGKAVVTTTITDVTALNLMETFSPYVHCITKFDREKAREKRNKGKPRRKGMEDYTFRFIFSDMTQLRLLFTTLQDFQPSTQIIWLSDRVQVSNIHRYDNPQTNNPLVYTQKPYKDWEVLLASLNIDQGVEERLQVNIGRVKGRRNDCCVYLSYKRDSGELNSGELILSLTHRSHTNGVEQGAIEENMDEMPEEVNSSNVPSQPATQWINYHDD